MFNWVVKVVPQPPGAPGTLAEETTKVTKPAVTKPAPVIKEVKKTEEESSEESGVLGWLSNGFISALPQPTPTSSPRLSRANSGEVKSPEDGERNGVITWVAQSLTKVLPQPDEKYREKPDDQADEHTEVYEVLTMPDYDPLPHIPVVDMVSDDEADTESINSNTPSQQVVNWLKQAIPHPAYLPPGAVPIEPSPRPSRSSNSLDKVMSPPPQSLSGISLDTDDKAAGMVGWFMSGMGLRMPQLVIKPKDEMAAEVPRKGGSALRAP
jgi:hypothetical protein